MKKEIENKKKAELSFPNEPKKTEYRKVEKNNLKNAIKAAGYSRKEIGDLIGVSERQVTNYIKGNTPIPEDSLIKLSELLNVSKAFILELTDKPETGEAVLYREVNDRKYSAYKPVYDLLENLNYDFEKKYDFKNNTLTVKIGKRGAESFSMDVDIFDFFVKEIRNYADNLISDYIRHRKAKEKLNELWMEYRNDENKEITDAPLTKEGEYSV